MPLWLPIVILSGLALGAHQLSARFLSQYFHPFVGTMLYLPIMFICLAPLAYYVWVQEKYIEITTNSVLSLVAMGSTGALFMVMFQWAFRSGAPITMVVVMVEVIAVTLGILFGWLILKEPMGLMKSIGILMALTGVVIALKG